MTNSVTDSNFEETIIKSKKLALVDFWAEWCGPCKQLSPIIDEVSSEVGDGIGVFKMDIDANPEVPTKYGIRSIPTLMLFKNGQVISTKIGSLPKSAIIDWINQNS